jgi:predicted ribosomally synthesized peptide with SipW-like signal peptide
MSDKPAGLDLTRRRVLAGAAGVGLASAAAGFGTSAYLSDTESFENNTITAGTLDLKVDWEEHYSYPQLYGFDDPAAGLAVQRAEPAEPGDYVGLPHPENPMVWVHEDDLGAYMSNTAIEAFPDPDNDGEQETVGENDDAVDDGFTYDACAHGADVDEDLTPSDGNATRTNNADTYVDDEPQPLINLQDVKPGDFGEFTLSFHLCGNPGYVWLQTGNVSQSGGELTEPEEAALGDGESDGGELAENIQTVWWYDDGDNVLDRGECGDTLYMADHGDDPVATLYEVDISGTDATTSELTDLDDGSTAFEASHIGASPDGETVYAVAELQDKIATYDLATDSLSIVNIDLNGKGPLGSIVQATVDTDGTLYAVSMTQNAVFEISDPGTAPTVTDRLDLSLDVSGADSAFTSTGQFYLYTNSTNALHTVDLLSGSVSQVAELETGEGLTGLAVSNSGTGDFVGSVINGSELVFFDSNGNEVERRALSGDLTDHTYGDLTTGELCEETIFAGTLAEAIDEFGAAQNGYMLNDGDCYQPGLTRYVGFAWWVPTDVGNEIQGDTVSFDLGFYTEQCRNNDNPTGP